MSVSAINSSPLQPVTSNPSGSVSTKLVNSSTGGALPTSDTISVSPQAVQLNSTSATSLDSASALPMSTTTLTAPLTNNPALQTGDTAQSSNVNQCHRHHHHRHGHEGMSQDGASFIDRLAQSIVADLTDAQGTTPATATSGSPTSVAPAQASDGSLIDKLASAIAKQLLAQYQISSGPTSGVPSTPSQVKAVA